MARDFEDLHDLDDLSDDELRGLVREHLAANNMLDIDEITVTVRDGLVRLEGRVGTDGERLIAEHVVTDLVGAQRCDNGIFVDPSRRALSPEAIDEHLADENRLEGLQLGDVPKPIEPTTDTTTEDLDAELFGTTDLGQAIQDGTPWIPPESPTQEGFTRRDEFGEDH
ncbi:MAG TPA: BON domain-containing protein [Gemmatimonadaceae bacterium]|nr:BON domain-containing protein [Gemmatimonadaceae bacterium]